MSEPHPSVSVIVPTMGGRGPLLECLRSLAAQDYAPFEVIVVDNASPDGVGGVVAEALPTASVVRLDRNLGFAGGCNRGIERARGEFVALINDDAVAAPGWLGAMVACAEADPRVGAVACLVLDGHRPGVLDSCGIGIGLDGMSRQADRGAPPLALSFPREVLAPSGCACLFRAEALADAGLFDEDFFAYCEDTDLGLRLRWAGWSCLAAPDATVTHAYSMTAGKASTRKLYWVERNHYWVAVKDFPLPFLLALPLATLWRFFVQAWVLAFEGGSLRAFVTDGPGLGAVVATIVRAQLAALASAPAMFAKRLAFRPRRKLSQLAMTRLLWRFMLSTHEIVSGRGRRTP